MRLRLCAITAIIALWAVSLKAQIVSPITWDNSIEMTSETEGKIVFKAAVDNGWHLYGLALPDGGPRPTTFRFDRVEGAVLVGDVKPSRPAPETVDMIFHLKLAWWDSDVSFEQQFKLDSGSKGCVIAGVITYQGCNDQSCIPPTKEEFELSVGDVSPAAVTESTDTVASASVSTVNKPSASNEANWWNAVTFPESDSVSTEEIVNSSLWYIFIWGFLGGLIALLTPCVWPMIPLTVSFFLKKNTSRRRSIIDASIYGGAIIVIYLVLGLAVTLIFGASKLNDLATNAVFNLIFFALLVVFAISFFGAFDIKLPAKWSNSADSKAERTSGLISIFFMAFTLALVSFSCTGPLIGTLLVEAASDGNIAGPAVGMGAFALALAIPFTVFAIFPSLLKEMPRSGGWLNSVKVVLGFLELVLSLKFLSIADLAYGWGILDREVFIAIWIILFVMLGMYLLGQLRFSHDAPLDYVSIPRFFMALASFSFAVYLLPGMWGAPLKGVSAFVPPLYTQDFNLYSQGEFRTFHDYDEGMRFAAENGRPVLIDFSGYGCVNCRKMEGAVFDTQEVSGAIKENFVLISLMVDDKTKLPEPIKVTENGKKITLETVGEKWSYLQRSKFAASVQPFYVVLDNDGAAMNQPYYYDEDVEKYVEWLDGGLKNYLSVNDK